MSAGRPVISPTAIVDNGVELGDGVVVWDGAKVRRGARLGRDTSVGTGAYIGAGVVVGDRVKVQNGAQVFEGAVLGDGVLIGPGAVLTNDRHPRAVTPDGRRKGPVDWNEQGIVVGAGASVGAGAVIVAGVVLGAWCLVGAGAVVVRSVDDHELVVGVPARSAGWVCRCGRPIDPTVPCGVCGRGPFDDPSRPTGRTRPGLGP